MNWVAVYYTGDGPYVQGPYETEQEALQSVFDFYVVEYGLNPEDAVDRYTTSGEEWITRLHGKDE